MGPKRIQGRPRPGGSVALAGLRGLGGGWPALQHHVLDLLHGVELGAALDDEARPLERLQRPQRAGPAAVRRDLGPGQQLVAHPFIKGVPRDLGDGDHLLVRRVAPGFRVLGRLVGHGAYRKGSDRVAPGARTGSGQPVRAVLFVHDVSEWERNGPC
jgi:hypothetical protein